MTTPQWKDLYFMGNASSLVTYFGFILSWRLKKPYYRTEICSNFPCVDVGISFGISLYEPRLSQCTLNFEKISHLHKFFLSQKGF